MSDKEIKKEKVVTKYDLKMQRREEEKKKDQRQRKVSTAVSAVIIVALVAWIASFPIRTYMATHETYVVINGENISRAEFDYNYNIAARDYINSYGAYLEYFGFDPTQDYAAQMYSDNMTWKDFFEEKTVDNLKVSKALKAEADAAGFTFDMDGEKAEFKAVVKEAAAAAKVSTGNYVKQVYGRYASVNRVADYIAEGERVKVYYEELSKGLKASDEEIQAYYQEHTDSYDSVDYYLSTFAAEITEDSTEEEIAEAMDKARELAEAAESDIMTKGNLQENMTRADVSYLTSDWLLDASRKGGDTTVIEDEYNHIFYVLGFVKRYLDNTPTANVRIIMTQDTNGQAILDEWAAGEATEESFAQLCNQYSADGGQIVDGGLYEGMSADSIHADLADWIFATGRAAGDTTYVTIEEGYTYVLYYVGQGDPKWKQSIANTLLSQNQQEYLDALSEKVAVEDPKENLKYIKIRAQEEAAAATEGEAVE